MENQAPDLLSLVFQIDCTKLRSVDESEGRLWAESRGFLYFETSAQTGEGINEMFQVQTDMPNLAVLQQFFTLASNDWHILSSP